MLRGRQYPGDRIKFELVSSKDGAAIDVRWVTSQKDLQAGTKGQCESIYDYKGIKSEHLAISLIDPELTLKTVHLNALHDDKETIRRFYTKDIGGGWMVLNERGNKTDDPSVRIDFSRLHFAWGYAVMNQVDAKGAEEHLKAAIALQKIIPVRIMTTYSKSTPAIDKLRKN